MKTIKTHSDLLRAVEERARQLRAMGVSNLSSIEYILDNFAHCGDFLEGYQYQEHFMADLFTVAKGAVAEADALAAYRAFGFGKIARISHATPFYIEIAAGDETLFVTVADIIKSHLRLGEEKIQQEQGNGYQKRAFN